MARTEISLVQCRYMRVGMLEVSDKRVILVALDKC